jgi:hypothetical protein
VPPSAGSTGVGDLVRTSIRELVTAVRERPDAWTVLLQAPESMPPGMRERYVRRRAEVVDAVRVLVRAARADGTVASDLDEELLGETLVALGELAGRLALRHRDRFDERRLAEFMGSLATAVLPGPGGRP